MPAVADAGINQVLPKRVGNRAQYQAIVNQHIQRDGFRQAQQPAPPELAVSHSLYQPVKRPSRSCQVARPIRLDDRKHPGTQRGTRRDVTEVAGRICTAR